MTKAEFDQLVANFEPYKTTKNTMTVNGNVIDGFNVGEIVSDVYGFVFNDVVYFADTLKESIELYKAVLLGNNQSLA